MRIIDLSQPLYDDCPNCPVHPPVKIDVISSHAKNGPEGWHMEHLSFASHTASHVDAPLHKIMGGKSLDGIPLERWTGPARIADLRGIAPKTPIDAKMLSASLGTSVKDQWVLLATGWGAKRAKTQLWLHDAPFVSAGGARWLVDQGARGVGIDHFSIGDDVTHATLLAKPVLIVEELNFSDEVFSLPQPIEFWALPLNLRAHSGGPCRPVLVIR
jgi:kynurenine formamidase